MFVWHAANPVEAKPWSIFWALFWVEICKVFFLQCSTPYPNTRLIGCVMITSCNWAFLTCSSPDAWHHNMLRGSQRRSKRLSRQHKLLSTDSFPEHQLWSMSSWAPLLCAFPAFYTIIVYTTNPLPCWIVIQSRRWFHTSQIRNQLLHNTPIFFKDV